jgi:hypothetical protein
MAKTVYLNELKPVDDLFQLLNGTSDFIIPNPYFKPAKEYIEQESYFKLEVIENGKTKGLKLVCPPVLYKVDKKYVPFQIMTGNNPKDRIPCRAFYFYQNKVEVKYKTSMTVNFESQAEQFTYWQYQVTQALELLMVALLENTDKLTEYASGYDFIATLFKNKEISGTKPKTYLENLKSKTLIIESAKEDCHLLGLYFKNVDSYNSKITCAKNIEKYFKKAEKKPFIGEHIVKTVHSYKGKEYQGFKAKLGIFFKYEKYAGQTLYVDPVSKKLEPVTPEVWEDMSKGRVAASFLIRPYFDCRIYSGAVPTNAMSFDVLQFIYKAADPVIVQENVYGDEDEEEDQPKEFE